MSKHESILASFPLFDGLEPKYIERLEDCASHATFAADQYLFRAGEKAEVFYVIRCGHVAVEIHDAQRGPIIVQTLGETQVLGWSWLVPPRRWCFDARALELTRVIVLSGARVCALCEEDHDLGFELVKRFTAVFAERLHAARFQLLDVYGVRT